MYVQLCMYVNSDIRPDDLSKASIGWKLEEGQLYMYYKEDMFTCVCSVNMLSCMSS